VAAPVIIPSAAGQKYLENEKTVLEGLYSVYKVQGKGELVTLKVTDGSIILVPQSSEAGGNIDSTANLRGQIAAAVSTSPVPAPTSSRLAGLKELPAEPVPVRSKSEQPSSLSMERGGGVRISVDPGSEGYDDCDEELQYEDVTEHLK
jgi:hypothetical protein